MKKTKSGAGRSAGGLFFFFFFKLAVFPVRSGSFYKVSFMSGMRVAAAERERQRQIDGDKVWF